MGMTRGFASRVISKGFIAADPAANVVPADGQGLDVAQCEAAWFTINVEAGGSQGTINVTLQESSAGATDVNASYAAIPNALLEVPKGVTVSLTAGVLAIAFGDGGRSINIGYKGAQKFLRAITSGVAGTPNFGMSVQATGVYRRHING